MKMFAVLGSVALLATGCAATVSTEPEFGSEPEDNGKAVPIDTGKTLRAIPIAPRGLLRLPPLVVDKPGAGDLTPGVSLDPIEPGAGDPAGGAGDPAGGAGDLGGGAGDLGGAGDPGGGAGDLGGGAGDLGGGAGDLGGGAGDLAGGPSVLAGNPDCAGLDASFSQLKIEPVKSGTYTSSDGAFSVTINVDGSTFDYVCSSSATVLVKGGAHANLYPSSTEGVDLTTPEGEGLSHITFCYGAN